METVIIGLDPHNLSATIEVVDDREHGCGRSLAQRLLEAGEHVVDVPAKLAARVARKSRGGLSHGLPL